ncbi:MAG TPA: class I SAM-dependent methyltransferase [Pyrinomonadaceae bacterium]|nr:class I SAM-dependent methyltransferase [Pyrinomonadaceae bacterium]
MQAKSQKELAYLHDLFVAPDWGERFAGLLDEHLELPKKGQALYVGANTGGHALALQQRAGRDLVFLGVDDNDESLELARAKAAATKAPTRFQLGQVDSLDLPDDHFDVVVGDASLVAPPRVPEMVHEMIRVAGPGRTVAITLPTASSFGEFLSIYWEAIHNCGLLEQEYKVEELISQLSTVADLEETGAAAGLENIKTWTQREEFAFASAEDFMNSPLVADFLMVGWLKVLPEDARECVAEQLQRIIEEERHAADFPMSIKATLVVGQKVQTQ